MGDLPACQPTFAYLRNLFALMFGTERRSHKSLRTTTIWIIRGGRPIRAVGMCMERRLSAAKRKVGSSDRSPAFPESQPENLEQPTSS